MSKNLTIVKITECELDQLYLGFRHRGKELFLQEGKIKELEAENAILRECVELIAGEQQFYCEVGDANKQAYARQVLKKLEPKNEKTQSEKLIDDLNAYAKQALKELDAKKGLREH